MEILIKNGYLYDPINRINGEKADIAIKNGKIVCTSSIKLRNATTIDATNKIVMPGGVDIHSHVAGPKINVGRIMRPEDHYKEYMIARPGIRRSGSGLTTPSTILTGYKFARMGWTTLTEPASPPLYTRHTHEELDAIAITDKTCFLLLDSNWFIMDYILDKEYDKCAAWIAWLLNALKGYAIKLVDPGSAEAWGWGKGIALDINDPIPGYNLTPRELIRALCKVNEVLNLPHSIHVHTNKLGFPGNYQTLLKTMDCVSDLASLNDKRQIIHITHIQFSAFTGDSWHTLGSGADKIAKYVNTHKHVSIDLGQITFGDTTTMTADAPFEFVLYHLQPWKWSNVDVEAETAAGIVPYIYRKKTYANAVQWCIGLETALLVQDPWRVVISTDHPNAGQFHHYPRIIAWLMSRRYRKKTLKQLHRRAQRKVILPAIDREYDFYEIAIITRAAPAMILGHKDKGHLGIGADADIAIYDLNPEAIDPSIKYNNVMKAFRHATYTIKGGEIVVKHGEIVKHIYGKTYYVKPNVPHDLAKSVMDEVSPSFKEWYSVTFENYSIKNHELRSSKPIPVSMSGK